MDKRAMYHVSGMFAQMSEIRHSVWKENGNAWTVSKSHRMGVNSTLQV